MPFSTLKLHPNLLKGLKDLGFARPTPIQADAIPPALAGRDVLACASTGSGKTAAFLLPIVHRLIDKPRGTTRALVLTPTRELAAQILEDLNDLAVHTPITGAAIFGGVGMGPQEHAFRSGVDILVATPGRLLDHFRAPYAKIGGLEVLVLDEADRMLDMGFLPDIRRVLRHLPPRRQTLFFSATMPAPILELTREMLRHPATINLERKAAPAVGITQAVYPVPQELKAALFLALLRRDALQEALVFTRTKHRANRLQAFLVKHGITAERIHGTRSQANARRRSRASRPGGTGCSSPPTSRPAASTSRRSRTWSTSTSPPSPRTTSTGSAARRAPRPRETPSRSSPRTRRGTWRGSSVRSESPCPA
jgi:ATP-dependent RNA helicase RhlE